MLAALQQSFWDRLVGVLTLRRAVYEAILRDAEATPQAWWIVVFLGLANGVALVTTPLATVPSDLPPDIADDVAALEVLLTFDTTGERLVALALGVVGAVVSWYVSSWLLWLVGRRFVAITGRPISGVQMRRLVGWGYAPSLASFLAPIPFIGPLLAFLGSLWSLVTGVMAVRVAFDISIGKAIAIEILAALLVLVVLVILALLAILLAQALV
jgi:hypothetical protein